MKRLTEEEALSGVQPPKLTKAEWNVLWRASLEAEHHAKNRTKNRVIHFGILHRIYSWAMGKGEV